MPEFDAEHRNLYRIADDLRKASSAGAPSEVMIPGIRALLAAVEDHFTHEERTMRTAHYPLLKWHKRQHDTVRKSANVFLARIETGDSQAAADLLVFFAEWLKNHTSVTDIMMSAFLRAFARSRFARVARVA